jgi:translocon-associated protein subunit alpha
MDFNYHIQNFSAIAYAKVVKPKQQATVAYSFVPADAFAGRPIGLTINLQYRDAAGNFFIDPVFNETVQIVEFDEGFDTETFFLYVTMAGSVILLLFLGYNFIAGTMYQQIRYRSSPILLLSRNLFFIKL